MESIVIGQGSYIIKVKSPFFAFRLFFQSLFLMFFLKQTCDYLPKLINCIYILDEPKNILSNIVKDGEWRTRPIALWGVIKSFISQLKIGEQITKISIPAEVCYPYSMLEMLAFRQLSLFKELFGINEQEDELERFMIVLKYFVCLPRDEKHNKKPWNPILGETHIAYIYDEKNGNTDFVSEQVNHHPPISAFNVKNPLHQLEVESNLIFGVRFGGNSAGILVSGGSIVRKIKNSLNKIYHF